MYLEDLKLAKKNIFLQPFLSKVANKFVNSFFPLKQYFQLCFHFLGEKIVLYVHVTVNIIFFSIFVIL